MWLLDLHPIYVDEFELVVLKLWSLLNLLYHFVDTKGLTDARYATNVEDLRRVAHSLCIEYKLLYILFLIIPTWNIRRHLLLIQHIQHILYFKFL